MEERWNFPQTASLYINPGADNAASVACSGITISSEPKTPASGRIGIKVTPKQPNAGKM